MGLAALFKFALECLDILAWPLFALGYPVCASIKAIEANSNSDIQKLITYWVSFSLLLLFENAFVKLLPWLPYWRYLKLLIVCYLVTPNFDGSFFIYKHFVRPCISVDRLVVIKQFNKLKKNLLKKHNFLVEVERCVKGNGPDAKENLILLKQKSNEPKADKISNAVETEEKKLVSTKEIIQTEYNFTPPENRAVAPLEIKETATVAAEGTDLCELPPSQKVQKEWTCAICQVRTQSESVLQSHLRGRRHKKACEQLLIHKKQASKTKILPALEGNKSDDASMSKAAAVGGLPDMLSSDVVQKVLICKICRVTARSDVDFLSHLRGRRHKDACNLQEGKNQLAESNVSLSVPEGEAERGSRNEVKNKYKQENLKRQRVEIRNSQWWCKICSVSCSSKGNMESHLNGKKHLEMVRASSDQEGSAQA